MMRHPVNAMGDSLVSSELVFSVACILLLRVAGVPAPEELTCSRTCDAFALDYELQVLWLHVIVCRGAAYMRSTG